MNHEAYEHLINLLNRKISPINDNKEWLHQLLANIGDARFVLIGEASHGTEEFYKLRMEISKALIQTKGFMAIAIESDWPDTYPIHRYIQGAGERSDSTKALSEFTRFPAWMWRNTTMPEFIEWLRLHNENQAHENEKIGFYGMDLYSLHRSMQKVIEYLSRTDPTAAQRAIERYACFDHLHIDPQTYGYLTTKGMKKACIQEAKDELLDLQHHCLEYLQKDGLEAEEAYFFTTQNARIVKNAEIYYRAMLSNHISSWNVRDRHMTETLNVLADHLESKWNKPARIIVWAHNSHLGDARATEMGERGEVNVGQLIREAHEKVYSIGFSTYQGEVRAANDWDGPASAKPINPGLPSSYEAVFHDLNQRNFLLNLRNDPEIDHFLGIPRLQRAIGVIYRPETERQSHYFFTHLPSQFDSLIHLDKTTALQALP